ncbi:hypothetical protein ACFY0N_00625 [Streptomyces vinaceus]
MAGTTALMMAAIAVCVVAIVGIVARAKVDIARIEAGNRHAK